MRATAKDLRFKTATLLQAVARGEEVVITYRGKPCARLVPLEEKPDRVGEETGLYGIWQDREDLPDVDAYVRQLRQGRFGC